MNRRHLRMALQALMEMDAPCSYTTTPSGVSYHVRAFGKDYHSYAGLMADITHRKTNGYAHDLLLADLDDRIARRG